VGKRHFNTGTRLFWKPLRATLLSVFDRRRLDGDDLRPRRRADVDKAQVTACVRVPDSAGRREPHLAEFSTTVAGLMALRDWLAAYRVTHVAMEATGVYWQPVWHILEDDFELTLCNARHVKQG
jgi:Transposase